MSILMEYNINFKISEFFHKILHDLFEYFYDEEYKPSNLKKFFNFIYFENFVINENEKFIAQTLSGIQLFKKSKFKKFIENYIFEDQSSPVLN